MITRGGNYGWRVYEGNSCTNNDPTLCTPTNYIAAAFSIQSYGRTLFDHGRLCLSRRQKTFPTAHISTAITAPANIGCGTNNQQILIQDTTRNISSFGEDEDGEIYFVGLGGTVEKIVATESFRRILTATRKPISAFFVRIGSGFLVYQ